METHVKCAVLPLAILMTEPDAPLDSTLAI